MDTDTIAAGVVLLLLVSLALVAGVLAFLSVVRDLRQRKLDLPPASRRIRLKVPRTRPLIYGQWERQIKPKREEDESFD